MTQKSGIRGGSPEFLDEAATMSRPNMDGTMNDRDPNFDGMADQSLAQGQDDDDDDAERAAAAAKARAESPTT